MGGWRDKGETVSMSREQFRTSVQRIVAVFSMLPDQAAAYLESIYEQTAWMEPYFFDQACKEIVRNFKVGARKPLPMEFQAHYNAAQQRANVPGAVQTEKCVPCEGIGYEYVYVRHKSGSVHEAVMPCKNCRKQARDTWRMIPEVAAITRAEYDQFAPRKSFGTLIGEAMKNATEREATHDRK